MSRAEFTRKVKRQAWDRSQGCCEAEGTMYGLPPGVRCGADMFRVGVEYDHIILDANSHDNSLENCAAVCPACHKHKSTKHDTPLAAKTVRQKDRNIGIKRRKSAPMAGSRQSKWKRKMSGEVVRRD